jgi:hypothetical protein
MHTAAHCSLGMPAASAEPIFTCCVALPPHRYRTTSTNTTFQFAPFATDKESADTTCKNNGGQLAAYFSQQEQSEVEQVGGLLTPGLIRPEATLAPAASG